MPRKATTKPAAKKTVIRAIRTTRTARKPAAKQTAAVPLTPRAVYLASLGAATRAKSEATKAYTAVAKQATLVSERVGEMTSKTAGKFAKKAAALVKETVGEGRKLQAEAQAVAQKQARLTAAEITAFAKKSQKAFKANVSKNFTDNIASARASAMQGVSNLEHVFETRVAKTLNTFGVPSVHDVRELQARMAELQKALNQLNRRGLRA